MKKKSNLKIAVQMDSIDKINKETDSTLALIKEAKKRGYTVFTYTVNNLFVENNEIGADANEVLEIDLKKEKFLKMDKKKTIKLRFFDFILIRQDPPFNMQYITATYLLEKLPKSCLVLNNPKSIRNCPEKLFVMDFYDLMPPTLISKNCNKIYRFINIFKEVVIKPLYGNGGKDVYYLNKKDPNLNIIVENLVAKEEHVVIQKFLKRVKFGDKRVLLINGTPVGAVNRIPNKNEIRANLHIGGLAKKTKLTKIELNICEKIKDKVRSKGLFFSGIDLIDGYLTEINVTSPTCIREIDFLNKTNISKIFWDEAVRIK